MAQYWLADVGDQQMGDDSHPWDDRDVYLRMSEGPEWVLPEESRAAGVRLQLIINHEVRGDEEAGSRDVIQNEQNAGRHQHRKSRQAHDRRNEPAPCAEREPHQGHALGAHVERRGDEVQRTQQLADAEDPDRSGPKNYAQALTGARNRTHRAQGRVLSPSPKGWTVTHKKRRDQN